MTLLPVQYLHVPFDNSEVTALLATYAAEIYLREQAGGRDLDMSQMDGTAAAAQSDDFTDGQGAFLGAYRKGQLVGCGGVRRKSAGVAEIKRMYVDREARGLRVGATLLGLLEDEARKLDCSVARLDTRSVLTEARAMYARAGYIEIERYNDNPFAQHWFEKAL